MNIFLSLECPCKSQNLNQRYRLFGQIKNNLIPDFEQILHNEFSFTLKIFTHFLRFIYYRMEYLRRRLPSSIQVTASQRASVISIDHSIWIQHGNNLKNEQFSKRLSFNSITCEEFNDSFHHPRADALSWVDPCRDHNALFLDFILVLLIKPLLWRNCQVFSFIACNSPAECVPR